MLGLTFPLVRPHTQKKGFGLLHIHITVVILVSRDHVIEEDNMETHHACASDPVQLSVPGSLVTFVIIGAMGMFYCYALFWGLSLKNIQKLITKCTI